MVKTPHISVNIMEPENSFWKAEAPSMQEIEAEFNRRLQKFVCQLNNEVAIAAALGVCETFVKELQRRYSEYEALNLGFSFTGSNTNVSVSTYAKSIKTLFLMSGEILEAYTCPDDVETYKCSLGKFEMLFGRAVPACNSIKALLFVMGYPTYARACPENAVTYYCSAGEFALIDGVARLVLPEDEDEND